MFLSKQVLIIVAEGCSDDGSSRRAVAVGPVSPVSTGPLFPSLVACLALPISAIAWRTPTQHPEAHRYHVETCEMAANSATELLRESSNNFPFLQAND